MEIGATSFPNKLYIEGTTVLEIWCSSFNDVSGLSPPGGGGGAATAGAVAAAAAECATLTNSGVETVSFGSSAGANLQPKIVHPPFSA
jgi:hypothetical protein